MQQDSHDAREVGIMASLPAKMAPWPDNPTNGDEIDRLVAAHARLMEQRRGAEVDAELDALVPTETGPAAPAAPIDLGVAGEVPLIDWPAVRNVVTKVFAGLGEICEDEQELRFESHPGDVATGMSVRRDGRVLASMPLHDVEVLVETLSWNAGATEVTLAGSGAVYTYKIPPELLRRRAR